MNTRFEVLPTAIVGLRVVQRLPIGDARGYFERMYCAGELTNILGERPIVQINRSLTATLGTVRGLHFQLGQHAETKLVSCTRGEVYDVAVDLRPDSPTFLQWHAEILSGLNHKTLVIPEGFAHGFQTLTEDCEMFYLHTAAFHAEAEGGLSAVDPQLAITWPRPISVRSTRDIGHPLVSEMLREMSR